VHASPRPNKESATNGWALVSRIAGVAALVAGCAQITGDLQAPVQRKYVFQSRQGAERAGADGGGLCRRRAWASELSINAEIRFSTFAVAPGTASGIANPAA
jgi:hypothetical protein